MANKRIKSQPPSNKKQTSAKQAFKKKQKPATKFRNDQLRESLDRQAHSVYMVQQPKTVSSSIAKPQEDSVNDLLNSLINLSSAGPK